MRFEFFADFLSTKLYSFRYFDSKFLFQIDHNTFQLSLKSFKKTLSENFDLHAFNV